ncbi:MAG: GntR family transcriptional regulator [Canibacter sp.]
MTRSRTLVGRVADSLRTEVAAGTYAPGSKLPSESQLSEIYKVSRPTVRAAIRELDAIGLIKTRHGVGSFVSSPNAVESGLERLESISDSIRAIGKTPSTDYASKSIRLAMPEEAALMEIGVNEEILEIRRTISADGEVVAYSYDLLPLKISKAPHKLAEVDGSVFKFLEQELGIYPAYARSEIHAVTSRHVAWGEDAHDHDLFILLNQRHYSRDDVLFLYSRTYFIEGRFAFNLTRSTPSL